MDGFAVSTAAIIRASAGFTDIQSWASDIFRGLIGSAGTYGGMAGDDSAGLDFARKYDPAADAVINGFGRAVAQLGGTANGLYDTAMTYINAEEDIVSRLHQPYQLPPASNPGCEQSTNTVQVPTAAGHGNWVVSHLIAQVLAPRGSRAAEAGCRRLAAGRQAHQRRGQLRARRDHQCDHDR